MSKYSTKKNISREKLNLSSKISFGEITPEKNSEIIKTFSQEIWVLKLSFETSSIASYMVFKFLLPFLIYDMFVII